VSNGITAANHYQQQRLLKGSKEFVGVNTGSIKDYPQEGRRLLAATGAPEVSKEITGAHHWQQQRLIEESKEMNGARILYKTLLKWGGDQRRVTLAATEAPKVSKEITGSHHWPQQRLQKRTRKSLVHIIGSISG
jgi:hypothetical protein